MSRCEQGRAGEGCGAGWWWQGGRYQQVLLVQRWMCTVCFSGS